MLRDQGVEWRGNKAYDDIGILDQRSHLIVVLHIQGNNLRVGLSKGQGCRLGLRVAGNGNAHIGVTEQVIDQRTSNESGSAKENLLLLGGRAKAGIGGGRGGNSGLELGEVCLGVSRFQPLAKVLMSGLEGAVLGNGRSSKNRVVVVITDLEKRKLPLVKKSVPARV